MTPTAPASAAKRMQLQALIAQKNLEAQRQQAQESARQTTGKGQLLDIRV